MEYYKTRKSLFIEGESIDLLYIIFINFTTQKTTVFSSTFSCHNAPPSLLAKTIIVGVIAGRQSNTHFSTSILNTGRINRTKNFDNNTTKNNNIIINQKEKNCIFYLLFIYLLSIV
jgi:hypothetical protein